MGTARVRARSVFDILRHGAIAAAALALASGCARTAELSHVSPTPPRDPSLLSPGHRALAATLGRARARESIAAIAVRDVVDRRRDPSTIGSGSDELLRMHYGVEADIDVAPWLGSWVTSALAAGGLWLSSGRAAPAGVPRGALTVSLRRFHLEESTWARGVAELDLRLVWEDGAAEADRITVVTTELMTEDDGAAWATAAGRLAGWSAHEVAAWTRAAVARRVGSHPPVL